MLKSRLFNVRLGLVINALVMFLVTMPDVAALGPDSNGLLAQVLQPWPQPLARARALALTLALALALALTPAPAPTPTHTSSRTPTRAQVLVRISIAVLCSAALFASIMKWFPPHMSAITSAVYLCVGVAAPFSYSELLDAGHVQGTLSTGIMLLFYSLVGNISGLNFKDVLVVNVGTLIAWVAMFCAQPSANFWDNDWDAIARNASAWGSTLTNASAAVSDSIKGTDSGVFFYLFLWLALAVLANTMSCRYQETYMRRRYVLMQRLKQETAKTDEFLYRMLPEAVVAQIKQNIQVARRTRTRART